MNYYSEKLMVSRPNMTVLSNRLCDDGLIERRENAGDRRLVSLHLTMKGLDEGCGHLENMVNFIACRFEKLSKEDIRELKQNMNSILNILYKL
jgi:DNA-binding MarR family transcriptional regulator